MNKRAFTFIEMTIVIVLIALFASLVLPRTFVIKDSVSGQAVLVDLRRSVDDAVNRAASSGQAVVMRISGSNATLATTTDEGNEQVFKTVPIGASTQVTSTRLNGTDVGQDEWNLKVFPDGQCSEAEIELHTPTKDFCLMRDANGRPAWRDGKIMDQPQDRWEAGTIEKRQSTQ